MKYLKNQKEIEASIKDIKAANTNGELKGMEGKVVNKSQCTSSRNLKTLWTPLAMKDQEIDHIRSHET